jgi:hypothetical protein
MQLYTFVHSTHLLFVPTIDALTDSEWLKIESSTIIVPPLNWTRAGLKPFKRPAHSTGVSHHQAINCPYHPLSNQQKKRQTKIRKKANWRLFPSRLQLALIWWVLISTSVCNNTLWNTSKGSVK